MPFAPEMLPHYEQIFQRAIARTNMLSVRADNLFSPGPVVSQIWEATRAATVVLADLTGHNPNVFYELGLAHAIGKPVILVAGQDDSIPFDIGHLRHARYNKNHPNWGSLLEEELVKALGEVLQSPEKAIPREFAPSQKHAYLLNAATGNALDVDVQTASSEGGKVIQFPLHGRLNQRWRLQPVAPDTYLIVSVMTSRVVSIFGEITEGAQRITQCEHQPGNPAQEWVMDFRHDDGSCMLRNKHTGQYLAVDGIDQHNLDVFQYPWREGLEQRWFPLVVT